MPKRRPRYSPIHPGEALADVMQEAGLTANALALRLRVPANRLTLILNGKRGITADTALRLARYFGTSPEFWMNLQARFEIESAKDLLLDRVREEVIPRKIAS